VVHSLVLPHVYHSHPIAAAALLSGSPGANSNLRSLMKNRLQQQQKQHQAYNKSYTEFLQRHQKALLELVMDDSSEARGRGRRSGRHRSSSKKAAQSCKLAGPSAPSPAAAMQQELFSKAT